MIRVSVTIEPDSKQRLTLDYEMTGDTFRITGGRVFEPDRTESLAAAAQDWGDQFRRDLDEALASVPPAPSTPPAPEPTPEMDPEAEYVRFFGDGVLTPVLADPPAPEPQPVVGTYDPGPEPSEEPHQHEKPLAISAPPGYVTMTQARAMLGVSQRTFTNLVGSGDLPSIKSGTGRTCRRFIKADDVHAFPDSPRRRPGRPPREKPSPAAEPEPEVSEPVEPESSPVVQHLRAIVQGLQNGDRPRVNMLVHGRDPGEDYRCGKRNGSPFREIDVAIEARRCVTDYQSALSAGIAEITECRYQCSPAQATELATAIRVLRPGWSVTVKPRGQYQVIEVTQQ